MLEKPGLEDEKIIRCLQDEYGMKVGNITFLPLGADLNTAVYRVTTRDELRFFLKLRGGEFVEASVAVPNYLSDLGMGHIIPSLKTRTGRLWANLEQFKAVLYPYVEGHPGYEGKLAPGQWVEFGAALKRFHSADIPPGITGGIPREKFSPQWRGSVGKFLGRVEAERFDEPAAAEMAAFLRSKRRETLELLERAGRLAQKLQEEPRKYMVCHGDIHGWNLLIDLHGALYMVDWDTLVLAPKERDLMFIGAGLGDSGYAPQEEEALFYQGYGPTVIDQTAIAYYRYERIIEDIAIFCQQVFLTDEGGRDRKQAVEYLRTNYLPDGTIARARQADQP